MKKQVVLVSGGLDSTIAYDLYPKAIPVFINYEHLYAKSEQESCDKLFGKKLRTIKIKGWQLPTDFYVPARNIIFAALALNFGANEIIISGTKDDVCIDNTVGQFHLMSYILSIHAKRPVTITTPFAEKSKSEIVGEYLAKGGKANRLFKTFSCYFPKKNGNACHDCDACFKWSVAMRSNGLDVYLPSKKMIVKHLSLLHTYSEAKRASIIKSIGKDWIVFRSPLPEIKRKEVEKELKQKKISYHALLMNHI